MADYKNVSFATFEERDSDSGYSFEVPLTDSASLLDGRLWVGYDFNRENARLYIDLSDGTEVHRLPFHPACSYTLLDPNDDMGINRGVGNQLVYFLDGAPIESTDTFGGPYEDGKYYTPVYLQNGFLVTCEGTTVTNLAQTFSGEKTFSGNVIVDGTTTLNSTLTVEQATVLKSTLDVTDATFIDNTLDVTGTTTLNSYLVLGGSTAGTSQIYFLRENGPSYFRASSGGSFCFVSSGKEIDSSNADLWIKNNLIIPGTTETVDLGSTDKKWDNVYANNFIGNASTASALTSATDKGSDTLPVYFSEGVPVEATGVMSDLTTRRDGSKYYLDKVKGSGTTTVEIAGASASNAGLVTTGTQTFAGNKTFNGTVTLKSSLSVSGAATLSSTLGVSGTATLGGTIIIGPENYGTQLPASGTEGQIFFQLIEG